MATPESHESHPERQALTFQQLGRRLGNFACPVCESIMRPYALSLASTDMPLSGGKKELIDDDGSHRTLYLSFLECPVCSFRLPANAVELQ